jgi:adhesin transport system outer membrane protein
MKVRKQVLFAMQLSPILFVATVSAGDAFNISNTPVAVDITTVAGDSTSSSIPGNVLTNAVSAPVITLQDAVKETIATNPTIQTAIEQRNSRVGELDQARAGYKPTIDLNAGFGYGRRDSSFSGLGDDDTGTRTEAGINLRQMIFDGFATRSEVARQTGRVNSAAYTVYGTAENTGLRATEVYLDVLRNEELVKLAMDNLAAHEKIADQVGLRSDSGVGRKSDQTQVEGRSALATSNLIAGQTNLTDAQANYQRVIGDFPTPGSLQKPEFNEAVLPASVDDAVQQALVGNPTLKSSQADVEAAVAQHRAAKSPFYPRFDLEIGRTHSNGANGFDGDDDDTSALIRMRYNLFRGGADEARRAQTANLIGEAKEVGNDTYRQVVESMRLSWNAYQSIETQLVYLKQHVESTRKTREAYAKQFNIGQRSLLDLLDSENELFTASREVIIAEYDKAFAQYRIMAAMGKLLEQLGLALPEEIQTLGSN